MFSVQLVHQCPDNLLKAQQRNLDLNLSKATCETEVLFRASCRMPSAAPVTSVLALPGWTGHGTHRGGAFKTHPCCLLEVLGLWRSKRNTKDLYKLVKGPLIHFLLWYLLLLPEESLEEPSSITKLETLLQAKEESAQRFFVWMWGLIATEQLCCLEHTLPKYWIHTFFQQLQNSEQTVRDLISAHNSSIKEMCL